MRDTEKEKKRTPAWQISWNDWYARMHANGNSYTAEDAFKAGYLWGSYAAQTQQVTDEEFDAFMTERFNEYARAGMDDESLPNYDGHAVIEEFIKDLAENGYLIVKGAA